MLLILMNTYQHIICSLHSNKLILLLFLFSVSCKLWKLTIVFIILGNMCMDPRLTSNELRAEAAGSTDECQVTPVIHVLQYPGCVPKPIPSFACIGRCASYIQVSSNLSLRKILVFIIDFTIFVGIWK